ncbi:MAG: hypothetical protein JXB88_09430 [Spirochaetales bacterium]|nr:hypothetical protein [Spirochaetales bacterium]
MSQETIKIKEKRSDNFKFKNWEQYDRIKHEMNKKRITMIALAIDIEENYKAVCAAIWGIPGRRNKRIERKIALYLGVSWENLFKTVKATA